MIQPHQLDPNDPRAPKYWRYETGGELAPAIEAYLNGKPLTIRQIAVMRAYLCQWFKSPVWNRFSAVLGVDRELDSDLEALRTSVAAIKTQDDIRAAIHAGLEIGIDPL